MQRDPVADLIWAHGFRPDALEANHRGALTPEQASKLRFSGSAMTFALFGLGVVCLALGAVGLISPRSLGGDPLGATGAGAYVALAFGVVFLGMAFRLLRRLPADLAAQHVSSVEGAIFKRTEPHSNSGGVTTYTYHYRIQSHSFTVKRSGYELLDSRLRYRVYYLPRANFMVNLEPIGGPPNVGALAE